MEPNILATCVRTQNQVLNKSGSLHAKRTFPWRASSSDVFTQAAQQPAPIPEVNAYPLSDEVNEALFVTTVFHHLSSLPVGPSDYGEAGEIRFATPDFNL